MLGEVKEGVPRCLLPSLSWDFLSVPPVHTSEDSIGKGHRRLWCDCLKFWSREFISLNCLNKFLDEASGICTSDAPSVKEQDGAWKTE